MNEFKIRDSGERKEFSSGMVRDTTTGKSRPDLVRDGPMLLRWIALLTNGAAKYAAKNWMKAEGQEEYQRFLESADRHYTIYITYRMYGINIEDPLHPSFDPLVEDHAAAVFFNINGAEYVRAKLDKEIKKESDDVHPAGIQEISKGHPDSAASSGAEQHPGNSFTPRAVTEDTRRVLAGVAERGELATGGGGVDVERARADVGKHAEVARYGCECTECRILRHVVRKPLYNTHYERQPRK